MASSRPHRTCTASQGFGFGSGVLGWCVQAAAIRSPTARVVHFCTRFWIVTARMRQSIFKTERAHEICAPSSVGAGALLRFDHKLATPATFNMLSHDFMLWCRQAHVYIRCKRLVCRMDYGVKRPWLFPWEHSETDMAESPPGGMRQRPSDELAAMLR